MHFALGAHGRMICKNIVNAPNRQRLKLSTEVVADAFRPAEPLRADRTTT